jgi:hypothetical protein
MELMSCKNIVPLYIATVHESTCTTSITAATWLFSCLFIISLFGMLMVMFRGACYPVYYFEGKELDYSSSEDDLELEEEDESQFAYDQDTLRRALEEDESEYYGEESIQSSVYDDSQYTGQK